VIQTFASRQAYKMLNGHYIPIIMNNISDESVVDFQKRRFYIQNYEFTMLGFLLDEEEFEVAPAVSRVFQTFEIASGTARPRRKKYPENKDVVKTEIIFGDSVTEKTLFADYTGDFNLIGSSNIDSYDVYINNDFYGSDIQTIQVNTKDSIRFEITKINAGQEASLEYAIKLL
jgi:hypothetical protein